MCASCLQKKQGKNFLTIDFWVNTGEKASRFSLYIPCTRFCVLNIINPDNMALMFASAASIIPRLIESMNETNLIVTTYIEDSKSSDLEIRQAAWNEAIKRVKEHGAWHSSLVAIKIFGDGTLLFTMGRILFRWLEKVFVFLRQICSQTSEYVTSQSATIKTQVLKFYQKYPTQQLQQWVRIKWHRMLLMKDYLQ